MWHRPAATEEWSHSADAMKPNPVALNGSHVMDPVLGEAGGMPPVCYQSHLVPSTAGLPTAAQTTMKKIVFTVEIRNWRRGCLKGGGVNIVVPSVAAHCAVVIVSL